MKDREAWQNAMQTRQYIMSCDEIAWGGEHGGKLTQVCDAVVYHVTFLENKNGEFKEVFWVLKPYFLGPTYPGHE